MSRNDAELMSTRRHVASTSTRRHVSAVLYPVMCLLCCNQGNHNRFDLYVLACAVLLYHDFIIALILNKENLIDKLAYNWQLNGPLISDTHLSPRQFMEP